MELIMQWEGRVMSAPFPLSLFLFSLGLPRLTNRGRFGVAEWKLP
jgi:hypothetical protein